MKGFLEILKMGLSGFCFLLAYFSYSLLEKEQQRVKGPREGILRMIRYFMFFACVLGVLVALSPLLQPRVRSRNSSSPGSDYVLEYTYHKLDLTGFKAVTPADLPTAKSIVIDERLDSIRKTSRANVPYVLPFYTTGLTIECDPIRSSVLPSFEQVHQPGEDNKKYFQYNLPLGVKPLNHTEITMNRFKFVNGFKDPHSEWWFASVKYPTHALALFIVFPSDKPCKGITAYRKEGIAKQEVIQDNPPIISDGGKYVYWLGTDEKANDLVLFEWQW